MLHFRLLVTRKFCEHGDTQKGAEVKRIFLLLTQRGIFLLGVGKERPQRWLWCRANGNAVDIQARLFTLSARQRFELLKERV